MKWGGNPDIQIGENEIKLGDTEITSENVLPTPTSEDVGKVPTVQEDGSYALANAGGSGVEPFVVTFTIENGNVSANKTFEEISVAYQQTPLIFAKDNNGVIYSLAVLSEESLNFNCYNLNVVKNIMWNGRLNQWVYTQATVTIIT